MKKVFQDKQFLKSLWVLALPITLQSFITSSLNLIDNVMVGKLGEASIASVGLANQYIFIFSLCLMGINAGASVFMAQYWGKKDIKSIKRILGLDMNIGLVVSALFALAAFLIPEQIMSVLSKDQAVIELGAGYLRIVAISCVFTNFTQVFSAGLRSTEQVKVPMYASLIGVLTNAVFNWIFIFGKFGIPVMGVYGAALATTIARVVEMTYIVGYVYFTKNMVAAKLKELYSFNMDLVKTYFKTSWSVIANELIFSIGMTAFSMAYARIGTNAVATMQIATTLNNIFTVLLMGMAAATAIMIGNKIGADEVGEAKKVARNTGLLTPVISAVLGVAIWILAPMVLRPFNVGPETYVDTLIVLRMMAVFLPIRAFNMVMIVGVFRGGGDTLYSMLVQAGTLWLYAVPLAFIGATTLGMSVIYVYLLVCSEECVKIVFELKRLKSGKWIHNIIQ